MLFLDKNNQLCFSLTGLIPAGGIVIPAEVAPDLAGDLAAFIARGEAAPVAAAAITPEQAAVAAEVARYNAETAARRAGAHAK